MVQETGSEKLLTEYTQAAEERDAQLQHILRGIFARLDDAEAAREARQMVTDEEAPR